MTVNVSPNAKNPTHHLSLSDGVFTWGINLLNGAHSIDEVPVTPSTVLLSSGQGRFGDWDPSMSHIEQRDWAGGRGSDDFSESPDRFWDSHNLFSMVEGKVFPALQWKFATGLRTAHQHLPGNVNWRPLFGTTRYIASSFTVGSSNMSAYNFHTWLRRVGKPGALTIEIWTDSSGNPGSLVATATGTITTSTVQDVVSRFVGVNVSAGATLTASTTYWVVAYGNSSDNKNSHWEVGVDTATTGAKVSETGSSWSTPSPNYKMYFRVSDNDIKQKIFFFEFRGALYALTSPAKRSQASKLYINGDRGKATSGGSTTLTDTAKSWATNEWAGAWVKIVAGEGKDQYKKITENTATQLTVANAWGDNPDNTSQYVIYATSIWKDISPTSDPMLDVSARGFCIVDDVLYIARGTDNIGVNSYPIIKMRWDNTASPPIYQFRDEPSANKADLLVAGRHTEQGNLIGRATNDNVHVSAALPPALWTTDLNFIYDLKIGDTSSVITNMMRYAGRSVIFKTDGLYFISSDKAQKQSVGMDFFRSANNGEAAVEHKGFLYYSWANAFLMRLYGSAADNVGPNRGNGLPDDRKGRVVALFSHPEGLFVCLDAKNSGYSSLLFRNDSRHGWHEIFRTWETGDDRDILNVYFQDCPRTQPRLWINVGGELVYQEWPIEAENPLRDAKLAFQHEATLELADIDMGAARLPKFFNELTLQTQNVTRGIEVHLDYQLDENIGATGDMPWTYAGGAFRSPEDTIAIHRGNARKIRPRLRLLTNDNDKPPIIFATVLEGYARTPVKYQWIVQAKASDIQFTLTGQTDHDPDDFLAWLKEAAQSAKRIHMRSIWEQMDDKYVVIEPPRLLRDFTNKVLGLWGGRVVFTARES